MKELFGQRLREQRIKHGLTLEQLAEKSELSSNYIGMAGIKNIVQSKDNIIMEMATCVPSHCTQP